MNEVEEPKWEDVAWLRYKGVVTDDVADAIRELVAREVFRKVGAVHVGVLEGSGAIELPQPTDLIMVAVNAIGGYRGVVRINYIVRHGAATGFTLNYWLKEGARTAEGLRVRVAVGRGEEWFTVEGVVPSGK